MTLTAEQADPPRIWNSDAVGHDPRLFESDEAVRAIGKRLLALTLPRAR